MELRIIRAIICLLITIMDSILHCGTGLEVPIGFLPNLVEAIPLNREGI